MTRPPTRANLERHARRPAASPCPGLLSVNEYGAFGAEQQPGPSAWYISRLERCNCDGARANWGMVGQTPSLHDTLGWLATANAGQPMGQWWVYKRYADQTRPADEHHPRLVARRHRVPGLRRAPALITVWASGTPAAPAS